MGIMYWRYSAFLSVSLANRLLFCLLYLVAGLVQRPTALFVGVSTAFGPTIFLGVYSFFTIIICMSRQTDDSQRHSSRLADRNLLRMAFTREVSFWVFFLFVAQGKSVRWKRRWSAVDGRRSGYFFWFRQLFGGATKPYSTS